MGRVMAFVKSNMAIVILCAVMIVVLPSALVGSSMLNHRLRTARQQAVDKDVRDLDQAKVKYTIPATEPGAAAVELSTEPNAELTRSFREARQTIEARIRELADTANEINKEGHGVLVQGLFPEPTSEPIFKKLEMAEKLAGKPGRPSVYDALLTSINAGTAADPTPLMQDLQDYRARELDKVRAERGSDTLSEEEEKALAKKLVERRIGFYQQRARNISVYADPDVFRSVKPKGGITGEKPTWEYFVSQWDYWFVQDLIRAVGQANAVGGKPGPLDQSPVKRIVSIKLDDLPIYGETSLVNDTWTPTDTQSRAPLDPRASVTGRRSSKANKLYDVRYATLTLVVDSAKIQDVINAISRTNFMSVIGVDVAPVDAWRDLDEGFYYGPAHVVEATFRVESVWLRSWTADLMPDDLRINLGMEARDPEAAARAAEAAAAAAPSAAPAPAAKGRRNQDDDDLGGRGGRGGGG
ncbi:MAG: hypothetical protein IT437_10230 [Phycisphaerales bacterium]|nr:hypothetical protein [Phycisphaerales bacterium]